MFRILSYQLVMLLICLFVDFCNSLGDPYIILGIPKSSSVAEIRKAYKQLAKEWHPDKNDNPAAEDKFVEITQAYELLSDPERRKLYDNYGRTEEPWLRPENRQYNPFDELFTGGGFRFQYSGRDITLFHKLSVTRKSFENMLVPKSWWTPYLILFYSDWCFACLQVEPIWRRTIEELEPIGVGIATVHADNEPVLARRASISSLPCLVLLVNGKTFVFKESLFSLQKVVEFVRNKLPYRLMPNLHEEELNDFLSGWRDNKVRALVFQRNGPVRLRYLLTAFAYRERVAFAFIQSNTAKGEAVRAKLQVPSDMDSLLLFNENTERPVASVSMINIPVQTLQDIINSNKYLLLPRLSSQDLLDALCPASPRKRLCVLLVSQDTPYHEPHRQSLRRFAQEAKYADKVCFMYIFQERQVEFVNALLSGESPIEPLVGILWRRDQRHIKYEWLPKGQNWASYNTTKEHLESAIARLLRPTQTMTHEAVIGELIDEHAQGIFTKIISRVMDTYEMLRDNLDSKHVLPVVSIVGTVAFIMGAGYLMAYLMNLEETRIQEEGKTKSHNCNGSTKSSLGHEQTLKIHELRAETYNGLLRLLRPGCRTILLLVDTQSLPVLLPKFHKTVWPYRKNKTLLFGILNLDRGIAWYKEILTLSMVTEVRNQPLNINPRNCIGTVLSLNGMRKYFCMYHAMHPECLGFQGDKRHKSMTKRLSNSPSGSFIGFSNTDSDDSDMSDVELGLNLSLQISTKDKYSDVIFEEKLLDGLANWLDRLFEGSTQRYYINYWPDYICK